MNGQAVQQYRGQRRDGYEPFVYVLDARPAGGVPAAAAGAYGALTVTLTFDSLFQRIEVEEIGGSANVRTTVAPALSNTDLDQYISITFPGGVFLQTPNTMWSMHDMFSNFNKRRVFNGPLCFGPQQQISVTFNNPHAVIVDARIELWAWRLRSNGAQM